jgi:hypothetical protein
MKKLAIAAAAVASLAAGVANAYTVGTFSNGVVVPNVIHDASGTTAVNLINQGPATAVYWTFFDQNSKHITDGCFEMTSKQSTSFVWSERGGVGTAAKRGYLVFAAGADTAGAAPQAKCVGNAQLAGASAQISGNAFQVDLAAKAVNFVPVIDGPLTMANANQDLTTMTETSLTNVAGAAQVVAGAGGEEQFSMRYAIDGATGGTDTRIIVWSTGNQKRSHTVNMYNSAQGRKSVNFDLLFDELDSFDPETIVGRPADYLDGFIEWTPSTASFGNLNASVVTYSVVSVPSYGAVQTILGSHR